MAQKEKSQAKGQDAMLVMDKLSKRLDMLDQRLDNMDSVVSALVERVMSQPLAVGITCPHCGKSMEISLIGNTKPGVAGR